VGITLFDVLLVAIGGIIGSLLRWQFIESLSSTTIGVFLVNQLGVLIAGFVAYRAKPTPRQRLFWITGFAGGFTTLSSFAFLLHQASPISGIVQAVESLLVSILILKLVKPRVKK
jgi:fluoride exporter